MKEHTPKLWFYLLVDFGFTLESKDEIQWKVSGSSDPVLKFVDLLKNEETLTIDQVVDALDKNEMFVAKELLQDIREETVYLKDLAPHGYEQLMDHFQGTGGFHIVEGWQELLKELDLSRHIAYVAGLGMGPYTCEQGLLDRLITDDVTIGELQRKLLHVDQRRKIPYMDRVLEEIEEALKVRIKTKMVSGIKIVVSYA